MVQSIKYLAFKHEDVSSNPSTNLKCGFMKLTPTIPLHGGMCCQRKKIPKSQDRARQLIVKLQVQRELSSQKQSAD